MNLVLHVRCFYYIDCLRIVVLSESEHATVKMWTMGTAARGFLD